MRKKKTVLVFGVFDVLHDGHRFFLRAARARGAQLIVAVAPDAVVQALKEKPPRQPLAERLAAVRKEGLADTVVQGDVQINDWSILKKYKADVIALGYDQMRLEESVRAYIAKENLPIKVVKIAAMNPARLHSSFLRGK